MTLASALDGCGANLVETYAAIGRGYGDAEVLLLDRGALCRSGARNELGNFGVTLEVNDAVTHALRAWLGSAKPFYLYRPRPLEPATDDETLVAFGLEWSGTLAMMAALNPLPQELDGDLRARPMRTQDELADLGQFVSEQFFVKRTQATRDRIGQAIARADIPLYAVESRGVRVGALMAHESDDWVGIYNFCIDADFRGAGLGSAAMRFWLESARRSGKGVCLQCEPHLIDWYSKLGFQEIGVVDIWKVDSR